ncbi:MAG: rRNA pseudouridine synthase [Candidatus Omnitrophota bacterium]|nr:MAG: rRNA pseudouridine synthase [Candidatus Omnitrophota bacterium]
MRLQVALAQLGFASRRAAAEIIKSGKVKVDGKIILEPGYRVSLEKNSIIVEGRKALCPKKVYLLLNKPKGAVSTVRDRYARRTVLDLLGKIDTRVYPVGRLDKDTRGLLLLTNDGELTHRLLHPKFGIKKVYRVSVEGEIPRRKIEKLEKGIYLEGKKTFPCKISILNIVKKTTLLRVELTEGRKRQIKKMFASMGHPVLDIERIAFGPLKLATLKPGKWRRLKMNEIAKLKSLSGVI